MSSYQTDNFEKLDCPPTSPEPDFFEAQVTAPIVPVASAKPVPTFVSSLVTILMGTVFGFALQRGNVFAPVVIIRQMVFEQFIMMQMFLAAMASSLLFIAAMWFVPSLHSKIEKKKQGGTMGALSTLLGGFILGLGMTLSGSCPGTVMAQIGAGLPNAGFVVLAGLLGSFAYSIAKPSLCSFLSYLSLPEEKRSLDRLLGVSFPVVSGALAVMMIAVIAVIQLFAPWQDDAVPNQPHRDSLFEVATWAPYVAGIMVGSLQIPGMLANSATIGSAGGYHIVVSRFVMHLFGVDPDKSKKDCLSDFRSKMDNSFKANWMFFYVVSVILGAFISASLSGTYGKAEGVPIPAALIGGFLIVFGSRMAAGCTSGHGVSGAGSLWTVSFLAVIGMFSGGIGLAFALKALNILPFH